MEASEGELAEKTEFAGMPKEFNSMSRARCCLSAASTVVRMKRVAGRGLRTVLPPLSVRKIHPSGFHP
jgi:hypothetical protein